MVKEDGVKRLLNRPVLVAVEVVGCGAVITGLALLNTAVAWIVAGTLTVLAVERNA